MEEIKREKVKSSNIVSLGYDRQKLVLVVEFKQTKKHTAEGTENLYYYPGFPKATFDEFIKAESVGKFFHAHVKGHFKAYRILGEM